MTESVQAAQEQAQEHKPNDKEQNFRLLEARLKREIEHEKAARLELEQKLAEKSRNPPEDDDDDDEPYIDKRKFNKKLAKFGEQAQKQTKSEIQQAVQEAISNERKQNWLKQNPDFYEVLKHAEKFAEASPELAESILEMPDSFARQQLVYKNIKALGVHKPKEKESSIQDRVNANQRHPGYQSSSVGTAPYASQGDYSNAGQKQAYDKMQELKNRLRLG